MTTATCPNCKHPLSVLSGTDNLTRNEAIVWRALETAHPRFASTRALNEALGYTDYEYTGAKVFIRRLRQKGYVIESRHTRGYRAVLAQDFVGAAP